MESAGRTVLGQKLSMIFGPALDLLHQPPRDPPPGHQGSILVILALGGPTSGLQAVGNDVAALVLALSHPSTVIGGPAVTELHPALQHRQEDIGVLRIRSEREAIPLADLLPQVGHRVLEILGLAAGKVLQGTSVGFDIHRRLARRLLKEHSRRSQEQECRKHVRHHSFAV